MAGGASALYRGTVTHQRLKPRAHRLRYRVFWLYLDLDEIDDLTRRLTLLSRNRFNLFAFHDRDHGAGTTEPLRAQVESHLRAAGLDPDGGSIRLFTMPRMLGYVFNPLSVYFCFDGRGGLIAILYEVNNTFGQRHGYLIPVRDAAEAPILQYCAKRFYVSPFMDMAMNYAFRVVPPAEKAAIAISSYDDNGPVIVTSLSAKRADLTDRALLWCFIAFPLMTLKVIAGIHWQAVQIWLKGVRLRDRVPPPEEPVTIIHPTDMQSKGS